MISTKTSTCSPLPMINGFDWWTNVREAGKNLSQIMEDMLHHTVVGLRSWIFGEILRAASATTIACMFKYFYIAGIRRNLHLQLASWDGEHLKVNIPIQFTHSWDWGIWTPSFRLTLSKIWTRSCSLLAFSPPVTRPKSLQKRWHKLNTKEKNML